MSFLLEFPLACRPGSAEEHVLLELPLACRPGGAEEHVLFKFPLACRPDSAEKHALFKLPLACRPDSAERAGDVLNQRAFDVLRVCLAGGNLVLVLLACFKSQARRATTSSRRAQALLKSRGKLARGSPPCSRGPVVPAMTRRYNEERGESQGDCGGSTLTGADLETLTYRSSRPRRCRALVLFSQDSAAGTIPAAKTSALNKHVEVVGADSVNAKIDGATQQC